MIIKLKLNNLCFIYFSLFFFFLSFFDFFFNFDFWRKKTKTISSSLERNRQQKSCSTPNPIQPLPTLLDFLTCGTRTMGYQMASESRPLLRLRQKIINVFQFLKKKVNVHKEYFIFVLKSSKYHLKLK